MKKSIKKELKDLAKLDDSKINYDDIPATDSKFWEEAEVVYPAKKKPVYLKLDEDIIQWFKRSGRGYQARINAVLKSYMLNIEKRQGH